jgi:hypothetical protein
MNYQGIYDRIIDRARTRKLEGYKEKHHIVPKCMGGSNKKENLIELTAREHFICHRLLNHIHPGNRSLIFASWMMSNLQSEQRSFKVSARTYEQLKKEHSIAKSEVLTGTIRSQEIKDKISAANILLGKKPPSHKGVAKSDEHKEKIRQIRTGVPRPTITCSHCNKEGGVGAMKQWHFDNCRNRI